jgi:hypothetical protein
MRTHARETAQEARDMCIRMAWNWRKDIRRCRAKGFGYDHESWLRGLCLGYYHSARFIPNERKLRRKS